MKTSQTCNYVEIQKLNSFILFSIQFSEYQEKLLSIL